MPHNDMNKRARGRPKGKEADVAVLREDDTFEHKSRKDIPNDPNSFQEPEWAPESASGNAVPEEAVRQGGAVENTDREPGVAGAQEWQQDLPDLQDPPFEGAGAAFAGNSAVVLYCNQLLAVCTGCLPPILPAGSEADAEEGLPEVSFCMPEFDRKRGTLNHQAYAMPGLCQIALVGVGVGIAHWCSCCPQMELQRSIFSGLHHPPLSPQYLCGQADKCIHLEALMMLAASLQLDAEALCGLPRAGVSVGDDAAEDDGVYLLPFVGEAPKAWVLGSLATECIVVIETKTGGRRCTSCYRKGKEKCWHVQKLLGKRVSMAAPGMSAAAFEARFKDEFDVESGKQKLKCRSWKPIAELHDSDEHLVNILRGRGDGSQKFPESCQVERAKALVCLGCGQQVEDSNEVTVEGTIFHLLAPVPTRVEVRTCKCGRTWHYDGRGDGVLNFNDKYSNQMWRTKYPFYTMWQAVLSMYAGSGVPPATLQRFVNLRSTFQDAWMDYITLQNIDYSASFKCACPPPVGEAPEPECAIGDGIMLGYRGDLSFLVSPYESVEGPLKTGSLHQKRIFVNDNSCRELLLRFARPVGKAGAGLTEAELGSLEKTVAAAPFLSLCFLLKTPDLENGRYHSSPMCRELLFGLATKSPVCAILPADVEPIVEHLLENESHFFSDLGQARHLAARAPVLFDFVRAQHSVSGGRLTEECLQLLRDLLRVARQAYVEELLAEVEKLKKKKLRNDDAAVGDGPNGGRTPKDWSDEEAFLRTGHYFSNQPIWRPLQRYAADYFSQKVGPTCTKFKGKHKNVTPGMYPFFCTGCSKCVGFVVLSAAESPRVVFEVLFCRWRRLKMFIYDNVCHLHTYALNREASWAASVQWLIDWMHTVNHKECSPAYGIARYSILHDKNSQLSEQKNSRLVCMKAQAAFMGQSTFLHYGRYFLHCLNRQIDLGDLPALPHLRN